MIDLAEAEISKKGGSLRQLSHDNNVQGNHLRRYIQQLYALEGRLNTTTRGTASPHALSKGFPNTLSAIVGARHEWLRYGSHEIMFPATNQCSRQSMCAIAELFATTPTPQSASTPATWPSKFTATHPNFLRPKLFFAKPDIITSATSTTPTPTPKPVFVVSKIMREFVKCIRSRNWYNCLHRQKNVSLRNTLDAMGDGTQANGYCQCHRQQHCRRSR